ncbi:hypothetical protein EON77_04740 [bacterium]|nr:MAG: hypothetical protein EON77_04740 [bacterium]
MRLRSLLLPGLVLAAGVAQAAPDPFDYGLANILILQNKAVQKELGITQAQRDRMNSYAKVQGQSAARVQAEAQKAGQKGYNPDQQKRIQQGFLTLRAGVLNLLTPPQLKRLRELTIRSAGTAALLDPNIGKRLKITEPQRKSMAQAFGAGQKEAGTLQQRAFQPVMKKYQAKKPASSDEAKKLQASYTVEMKGAARGITAQMQAIEKRTATKMLGALTASQRAGFEALKGKPAKA